MVSTNGEVIGVLRYVTATRNLDMQILSVFLIALLALGGIMAVVLISSNYYVRSIIVPIGQITEKAKRIAGGSYGIQIQTKYDDEIGELADTINEMSIQISQNEKMQHDFISSLSHELRTPLTSITGWSETLLCSDDLDAGTRRGVEIIRKEASRLTEMVVELLDFTRMESDRLTLNIRTVDLRSEFEDTVFMYSSRLKEARITLDYEENDDDIPEISCDPERMRQVFLNLLDNAAKHGGSGQKIVASMCHQLDFIEICIRDFGPGIPEDELPLVKKKFYKGSSKARGTGIGLAVCDEIVAMHGGELIIENAEDGGTRVKVLLPITQ
jgi:signal transduction histidine kinase